MRIQKKIAVVGAGIYGSTVACKLAQKFDVDLIEKSGDILQESSAINQFRLHKGYHYPRSKETALSSLTSLEPFSVEYKEAIILNTTTYYAISKTRSKTTANEYLKFLNDLNLKFKIINTGLLESSVVDLGLIADENLLDYKILKNISREKLKKAGVRLLLNTIATKEMLSMYDYVVICTYSNINELIGPKHRRDYQFEVCEKLVIKLPKQFSKTSIVILDGPFMCIDPYGKSGYHLMGNVVHAIHASNVGKFPTVPLDLREFLNEGIIKNPEITNFDKFIKSAAEFIPDIKSAKHIGSMFTVRTVLPHKDKTDERPTIVRRVDRRTFTVFSGKISSCVLAAQEIFDTLSD